MNYKKGDVVVFITEWGPSANLLFILDVNIDNSYYVYDQFLHVIVNYGLHQSKLVTDIFRVEE